MKSWEELRSILPEETQAAWEELKRYRPDSAYLVGGTALTAHLAHRKSRDLDFFLSDDTDLRELDDDLSRTANWRAEQVAADTLNGYLDRTKVQFLRASDQVILEPLVVLNEIPVAGLRDIAATKMRAVTARGELRDYFDLLQLETVAHLYAEEGLALFLLRYRPRDEERAAEAVIRALGSFGDVADDPGLPMRRSQIESYWRQRQVEVQLHAAHDLAANTRPQRSDSRLPDEPGGAQVRNALVSRGAEALGGCDGGSCSEKAAAIGVPRRGRAARRPRRRDG